MKAITPVVSVILLLLVTISVVGFAMIFFQRTVQSAGEAGEAQLQDRLNSYSLRIESASANYEIYVRNTGTSVATNLAVYVDGKQAVLENPAITINPGATATVRLDGSSLPNDAGDHKIEIKSAGIGDYINKNYLVVAVVQDASCTCAWTVGNCPSWWASQLTSKKFAVKTVSIADIDTLDEMSRYKAIVNPYGEYYPETAGTTILDNIKEYVKNGGYWFESGGWSFYYSCGAAPDLNGNADDRVCVNTISDDSVPSPARNKDASYSLMLPASPASLSGSRRPSTGMAGVCGDNQEFKGIYKDPTKLQYGPAMHCYGKGCIARTDNTDSNAVAVYADILNTQIR